MVRWIRTNRAGPIGVDLGTHSVKLVQFSGDQQRLLESVRWDLPPRFGELPPSRQDEELSHAIKKALESRGFRGRDAVLCLSDRNLFMQNIRVAKHAPEEFRRLVHQEAAGRLPYSVAEAEIRFLEASDVRHGEGILREVIVLACHRPELQRLLKVVEHSGLRPVAVDIEPAAVLRGYAHQFRREEDKHQRVLFVHIGYSKTAVVIAEGSNPLFLKYIEVGGKHLDLAVARHLKMDPGEAAALRRHNGDRRADQQDAEITASIGKAIRPVIDKLAGELSMCVRYHSVTFRGKPLARMLLGGGEATPEVMEALSQRLDIKCDLGDPLRNFDSLSASSRPGQWDVAAGLALKPLEKVK